MAPVNPAEYWEDLARREAYFPVLTAEGEPATPEQFFATGEADIAALLEALRSLFGHELALNAVLDFGCGAGRLTLPLARRATRVVACDIAPTMLAHARKNAEAAGLRNIEYVLIEGEVDLPQRSFDFICSLAVFQYIPAVQGYGLIRSLARLLAPGGIGAIQLRLGSSYNERRVVQCLDAAGAKPVARLPSGTADAVLVIRAN